MEKLIDSKSKPKVLKIQTTALQYSIHVSKRSMKLSQIRLITSHLLSTDWSIKQFNDYFPLQKDNHPCFGIRRLSRQTSSFCCYKNSVNLNLSTAVSYLPSRWNYLHVQTHKLMMRYCFAVTTHCAQVENTGSTTWHISWQVSLLLVLKNDTQSQTPAAAELLFTHTITTIRHTEQHHSSLN